jgi:SAM-dependent methyltransferase
VAARKLDGSAGDADYAVIGGAYADHRRADPRISTRIVEALGDARTVLNVGAGTGGYEPTDRTVTAVEPSASMRARRPRHLPAAVDAVAEDLPFADDSFDAAMAVFTVHQWHDLAAGLRELRRVTRGPVVILTCDRDRLARFWLHRYAPEVIETEAERYPAIAEISDALGGETTVSPVPIPVDCTDGFNEAYFARPERLLDARARLACSAWSFVAPQVHERFAATLARHLDDGTWERRYGHLRSQPTYEGSLVLVVGAARPLPPGAPSIIGKSG